MLVGGTELGAFSYTAIVRRNETDIEFTKPQRALMPEQRSKTSGL